MPNPIFGEAAAKLSDGRTLTLRYDFNALCEIEDADGRSFTEINSELQSGNIRIKTTRAVLFGGLRAHHPDLTTAEAGDLMLTEQKPLLEAMQIAMQRMQATANPRKGVAPKAPAPPRTTSKRSSRSGAKPG